MPAPTPPDPGFRPPPLACDCHCHVFGPADRFPYAPARRYTPDDVPREALAALHARLGLERAVVVQAAAHGTDHAALLDAIAADPKRMRGVGLLDRSFDEAAVDRLHQGGVRGARFNFMAHLGGPPDPAVLRHVHDLIRPFGWHLVFHIGPADVEAVAALIPSLSVPVVIDHMARIDASGGVGQPAFRALVALARRPDVWVKVSGGDRVSPPPYDAALPLIRALIAASPDRTLWGTDFPHPNHDHTPDDRALVDLIPRFAASPEAQRRLLVDNPAHLYGF